MSSAPALRTEPETAARSPRPLLSSGRLLAAACAVLLLAPLAFGAVEPWSIFALEACALLLLIGWAARQWIHHELKVSPSPLYAPMLAFAGLVLAQWLTGITAYRHRTYSHLLLYAAYGMLAWVVTQTLRRSSQLRPLAWVLCGYGAVVAAFALFQGLAPNGKLYWIWTAEQGGLIYGPYVNHNHYAGLMEMLAPFPLVLASSRFTHGTRQMAAEAIGALMAGTIFLSGSRGGMLAFAVEMAVLAVCLRPHQRNWRQPAILGAFLVLVIGLLIWIGGNEMTRRLASIHSETRQELSGGVRLTIARDSLRMWKERPLLGWGLGTFPEVYPQFRSFYTSFFVNQAHNDYAQLLTETGLAGFAIALWFLVLVFRRARAKLKNWPETANGVLTLAALVGCVGILVHSLLDFNLQIPANAALFYVLCAVAAGEPLQESQRRSRRHHLILEPQPELTERE
ncbi:MAG: O-antigen ligase family protein [Terriglobales bacterium]